MNIYVLRHGQTDYNIEGKFQGKIDIPINQKGSEQAKKIAKELNAIKFDIVISSPLKRAIQTAQIAVNTDIVIDNRLIERSFGKLEGKKSIANYEEKVDEFQIESIEHLKERVYNFLNEAMINYSNYNNILLVTHACIAKMIECYFSNTDYSKAILEGTLQNGQYQKYHIGGKNANRGN